MSTKIRRILLIHADNALKDILLLCLETTSNYEIITASSTLEGIEKASDVDAILLDIESTMSDLCWQEMVQRIKQISATSAVPLILLTAIPQSPEMIRLQQQRGIQAMPFSGVPQGYGDPLATSRSEFGVSCNKSLTARFIFVITKSFDLLNLASQISLLLDDS